MKIDDLKLDPEDHFVLLSWGGQEFLDLCVAHAEMSRGPTNNLNYFTFYDFARKQADHPSRLDANRQHIFHKIYKHLTGVQVAVHDRR